MIASKYRKVLSPHTWCQFFLKTLFILKFLVMLISQQLSGDNRSCLDLPPLENLSCRLLCFTSTSGSKGFSHHPTTDGKPHTHGTDSASYSVGPDLLPALTAAETSWASFAQ